MVEEFRILTSNYTAEFGGSGGGIVSVVTKSGSNTVHGSAYDYIRNDAFNANSFFNNSNGLGREILKRNQLGAATLERRPSRHKINKLGCIRPVFGYALKPGISE